MACPTRHVPTNTYFRAMILIADGGSTKTAWTLLDDNKNTIGEFRTEGYNPYFWTAEKIAASIKLQLLPQVKEEAVTHIYFYGAGCSTPEKNKIVELGIAQNFHHAKILVTHDLLAAARALLKRNKGFAAILGTGANTCLYDGFNITHNIDSLGYLLGDEGSGAYIGRKLVRDYMRGYLPGTLALEFSAKYGYTNNEQIFNDLYTKPYPNRTLANFCNFASEHSSYEYIQGVVHDSFEDFFKNLVSRYPNFKEYTFNCIGSVGFIFKDILVDICENKYQMKAGMMLRSPIKELVQFHVENEV
jgi:glucosamine kinase